MIVTRDSCIRIPKTYQKQEWYQEIMQHLTRRSESFANSEQLEIKFYYDTDDIHLLLPRYFPTEKYGITVKYNGSLKEKSISINEHIKPRNQKQINAIDWLLKNDKGVLCMKPGEGKTVVAIKVICKLGTIYQYSGSPNHTS